jgi:hypothetical protein
VTAADSTDPENGGCAGTAWSSIAPAVTTVELEGSFADSYGGTHEITSELWVSGGFGDSSFFHISQFSNSSRFAIAHNNKNNPYSAGKWSRFDWAWFDAGDGIGLWYCQTAYNAETETAALEMEPADASDPPNSGCAGFSWSRIGSASETLVLSGNWIDDYESTHQISSDTWTMAGMGVFHISQYSNLSEFLIAQNDTNNAYSADKWSRIDWTWYDAGEGFDLYFCQTSYNSETEEDALEVPAADPINPAAGGCSGFSWSKLTADAE